MPSFNKQGAAPWGGYPYAGETMAAAGCGPTAVANVLDKNPWDVAQWMQANGYASNGSGTYHEGIPAAFKHYGFESQQLTPSSLAGQMSSGYFGIAKTYIQAGECAVFLMGGTSTGCTDSYWSRAGHYIAIVGYDEQKNLYRVSDGANAARDGWHTWEDFAGRIKHIFLCSVRWKAEDGCTDTDTSYTFTVEQISTGAQGKLVKLWQLLLKGRGLYAGAIDGSFGMQTRSATINFQTATGQKIDGIVGNSTWAAMIPIDSKILSDSKRSFTFREIVPGYQGIEAYFWQNLLRGYGYDTTLDTSFGEKCWIATADFQKKRGMAGDGVVGANTLKHAIGF